MAAVVSLNGIDEAIKNLDYKAKDSPKARLIQAIRGHYSDKSALTTLQAIDPDTLVSAVWDTVLDKNRLRSRRKNLASLRSSVNLDLKLLFEDGKNPDGIIIGPSNTFVMSDEAKDQMLTSVAASVRKDGSVSLGQITQTLSVIEDLLVHTEKFSKVQDGERESGVRRLKQLIKQISMRIDLDTGDGPTQGEKAGTSGPALDPGEGHGSDPGHGRPGDGGGMEHVKSGFGSENSEIPEIDGGQLEGTGGGQESSDGTGGKYPGSPLGGTGTTLGFGGDTSGAESGGSGSVGAGESDLLSEESTAEEEDLDEVELIEEPEDLEVVDEPDELEVSDELPAEGLGDLTGGDQVGAMDGASRELTRDEGLGNGPGGDAVGAGHGDSEWPGIGGVVPGGTEGDRESSGGTGGNRVGTPLEGIGAAVGPGGDTSGTESGGSGSVGTGEGDLLTEEYAAKEEDLDEVELIDEPEDLEVADEPDELEVSDELPTEGLGEAAHGHETGMDRDGAPLRADAKGSGQGLEMEEGSGGEPGPGDERSAGAARSFAEGGSELDRIGMEGMESAPGDDRSGTEFSEIDGNPKGLGAKEAGDGSGEAFSEPIPDADLLPADLLPEEEEIEEVDEVIVADDSPAEDGIPILETGQQGIGPDASIIANEKDRSLQTAENEMGLPLGSLGLDPFEDPHQTHSAPHQADHKLLAEAFDGYLGAMERFFNQYILIPKGAYAVGGGFGTQGLSEKRIRLPAFYMGKFPVTNALFEIFVEKTGYRTTAEKEGYGVVYYARRKKEVDAKTGRERFVWNSALVSHRVDGACWYQPLGPGSTLHRKRNHPVVQVSLEDATAFAAWTGKRLPSEAEWEAASRSRGGHLYPWGDAWMDDCCNVEANQVGDTTPVDAYLEAAGPFGIADTLGNVMEWTLDWDQVGENDDRPCYIVKGGSWASTSDICLCSRFKMEPTARSNILGFRCVAF